MGKNFVADPEIGKQNVRNALARLEKFTASLATPEAFKGALRRGSKGNLHKYSLRNQALMLQHRADADHIGTFKYWVARGRKVVAGRGTHLLMPRQFVVKDGVDPETPGAVVDEETGEAYVEKMISCFKAVMYWDIRDTTDRAGNPYVPPAPQPAAPNVKPRTPITDTFDLSADELERAAEIEAEVIALVKRTGYRFDWATHPGAYGAHSRMLRQIKVDPSQNPLKRVGTVVHEAAHMLEYELGTRDTYDLGELVAEGAAFTVLARYDLDTSAFSFGYVERYGANAKMFAAGLRAIQKIVDAIVSAIEAEEAGEVAA